MKKWNIVFNDALATFHLRLYGFQHMLDDHRHFFVLSEWHCAQTGYYIPYQLWEHWLEREIVQ